MENGFCPMQSQIPNLGAVRPKRQKINLTLSQKIDALEELEACQVAI